MFGAWAALAGLAGARVRRRAGALLAVALGVAAAAAAVLAASPLSLVSRQSAMQRSLQAAPAAERALRVTVLRDGRAGGGLASADSAVRDGLRGSAFAPGVARAVRFGGRPVGRTSVVLTGVDAPDRWIALRSGRLPRVCSDRVCEVVAIGGTRVRRSFVLEGLRIRVVGAGRLDGVPLGAVPPGRGSVDASAAFVAASGVERLARLRRLRALPRTFAWARVLDPALVHPWSADRLVGEMLDARTTLSSTLASAQVRVPSDRIAAEQARGRAAGAFALVIAGLAATVLLAFAAFAAAEQHADVALELERLRAMAARRRHLAALVLAEAAVPALFGVLLGFGLAAVAGLGAAAWAGMPAGPILREGLFSSGQVGAAVALWAAAVLVVAGVLGGAQSRAVRIALEAGCAVVIGALLWQAASRGRVDASELARGGTADPVLLLAPGAIALACGLIALRVVPAALRALARAAGRTSRIGGYLTLVSLARAPGRTAAAVAVVAVAAAAATFALGHARALQRGELDQAAYRTAGDVRTFAAVAGAPDSRGTPVIRTSAETLATFTPVQLLGVGAGVLPRLPGWRADFADEPLATVARRLDGNPAGVRMRGIEIPRDARAISLRVTVDDVDAVVRLAVQRPDGTFARLLPATELRPGRYTLSDPVPPDVRGGRAVAFEVSTPPGAGGARSVAALTPGALRARLAGGRRVTLGSLHAWESSSNTADFANGTLSYSVAGASAYLAVRAPQPLAPDAVPVLATPGLARQAAANGRLPLRMVGADLLRVQVVGVVKHVPTAGRGEAVVADVGRLFAALNAQYPGLGTISERWTVGDRAPGAGRELRLDALARQAAADPLSRGVLRGLWGLALLGGLVALAALALAVASAARDRGGEQAELEAIGVPPRSLRVQMIATATVTAITGLLAGVCGGAALASAFTGLVALGADGRSPLPDLLPAFPWPLALALALAAAAIATAAASAQARRAFRADALGRLRG
jgi:hypothetical protein